MRAFDTQSRTEKDFHDSAFSPASILTILLIVVLTGGALAQSTAPSLRPAAFP
ncbi:hypothetical protein [Candidatus Amarolinea dominans]|uniref:hypothetical protein n=1 Tax=Candidatus Amarolinea dominans TaxID=3140696 RepID=UPI001D2916B5|nr:hypothetical protein [Anaerolineae bacterium]